MRHLADDIAVAQVLSMGAMHYAWKTVTVAHGGESPPKTDALAALDSAAQSLVTEDQLPALVAGALRDLQLAAVLFTVQIATSNGHGDPKTLQQLEDKLVALLERRGVMRVVRVQDDFVVAQRLGARALEYARQIIIAEDSAEPIGSIAVESAVTNLQVAAVTFAAQLAISEGHDPKELRRIEKKLVKMLTHRS